MHSFLSYHWHRLSSYLHRARVRIHSNGYKAIASRLLDPGSPRNASPSPSTTPAWAPTDGHRRLLVVDSTTPRTDRDSGSLRAFNLMRLLREEGYAVDFLPDDRIDAGRYTADLRRIGVRVHCGQQATSHPRWFSRQHQHYDAIVIARYHLAACWIPMVRRISPSMRIVFDTVDLHHLREQREAELQANDRLMRASMATRKRELGVISRADVTWVVSPVEREEIRHHLSTARIEVVPNLHLPGPQVHDYGNRHGMLFVGGGRHPPNVDAVRWLLKEIFPLIRNRLPTCTLHIVGEDLETMLADTRDMRDGVLFHGHVPDLAPLLDGCRVGLAPLRFGAGVKGKVNQYMVHGLPTVATTCASEGMHLVNGHDVAVANDCDSFAAMAVELHEDPGLWARLSEGGLANVRNHFSFDAARDAVVSTFTGLRADRER